MTNSSMPVNFCPISKVRTYSIFLAVLLLTLSLKAQSPTDFSGKWEFDQTNSQLSRLDVSYDGTIIMEIIQNSVILTSTDTYIHTGRDNWSTATDTFLLDGKDYLSKDDRGTTKKSAKWSPDKKFITFTYLDNQLLAGVPKDFLHEYTYKLFDDGQTLTVENHFNNPVTGELRSKLIYHKK